jgi:hypothetical protein
MKLLGITLIVTIAATYLVHTELARKIATMLRTTIHSLPGVLRYPILCIVRLALLLTGLGRGSSHHAAGQALLGVGFYVEYQIIRVVFLNKNPEDAGTPTWSLVNMLPIAVLLPLFYHQFVIFRNFTLPTRAHDGDELDAATEKNPCRTLRSVLEFIIYMAFGVITGEAGYLYAIGHVSESTNSVFLSLRSFIGPTDLKTDLKSLFVLGAALVCALIIVWDLLVLLNVCICKSKSDSESYFANFWKFPLIAWFFALDILSLLLWLTVATIICPNFERFAQDTLKASEKGALRASFFLLEVFVLLYAIVSFLRFVVGCNRIATAASFEEARKSPL